MTPRRRQSGFLLVTVVVTLFLVATIAIMLSHGSAINANSARAELESERVDYVAEAGMQHALWRVSNNACMGDLTIVATSLGPDSYAGAVSGAAAGTAYSLVADQDAWIRSDDITRNNGTDTTQHVRFESGIVEQTLTRFDLSSLPAGAQVNAATAWFYLPNSGAGGGAHPEGSVSVHQVTTDWTESNATWQTIDGNFANPVLATISAQPVDNVWVSFNLTAQVQAWANGEPNYGILMRSVAEGVHGKYSSREDGANAPRIEVVIGSGPASPVNIEATGTLANGVSRVLTQPLSIAYQPQNIHTITPDPTADVDADAEIWAQSPTSNYGSSKETWVSSASNDTTRTLLRFNIAEIPAGARVTNATLSLQRQSGTASGAAISAHRITSSWLEASVSWNDRDSTTQWITAGGDIDPSALATAAIDSGNQRYEWDVTSLARDWVDGSAPNNGIALVAAITGMAGERFYTSDTADPTRHPQLAITFACECGTACMAPISAGNILMPVTSTSNPTAGELQRIATLESWGYVVDTIWQESSQANFNSGFSNNDVVYVPSTVSEAEIGSKLTDAPIGVVTEHSALVDELGIATGVGQAVGREISIDDTSHYISRVFVAGSLPLKTAGMALATTSGSVSTDGQVLASIGAAGAVVAVESGGSSTAGGTMPARRVFLPIGSSWDYSTNNAQLIVQRAIDWAMQAGGGVSGQLLFVVGDATSVSKKDTDRKALFETWGYAVTLIDDAADQVDFDAELASHDVVYVSNSIGGQLDGKLDFSTLGIVNEDPENLDNFGFGSQVPPNTVTTSGFTATDASHYISVTFAGAGITHFTRNLAMPVPSGTLAPDLGEVATLGTLTDAVPFLETGAERWDGTSSPGRRINLPIGAANVSQLTADGLTLLQRAITWGAGREDNSGKTVLMVVVDPSSLTSQEIAKQALIESWGFATLLIDESEPQEAFDKYLFNSDVVFVSEDVQSSNVGLKLTGAPIGVVTEEANLSDELGFSDSIGWGSGTELKVDNSYYITAPLPLGQNTVLTTSESLAHLTGAIAADLRVLAKSDDGIAASCLDMGVRTSKSHTGAG